MSSPVTIPEPVANIARLMSRFESPWALCGGWAVDSWLGRVTREHGDIDVTVFHSDQRGLFDYLAEWNLIAHDPNVPDATTEPWNGRILDLPAHIHARPPGAANAEHVKNWVSATGKQLRDGQDVEFILNQSWGGEWVFAEEPRITVPLEVCVRESPWGLPALAPEGLAFFKATAYFGHKKLWARPHDVTDFQDLLSLLSGPRRTWLRASISALHPGHPWLSQLA